MKRVAVLRGGPSEEYEVSMKSGKQVLDTLKSMDYAVKDIVITKKGEWLDNGIERTPDNALEAIDIAFLALHGKYGEDGGVQKILQRKSIPFTGSRAFPSAIAFNKHLTKETLLPHGMLMPKHVTLKGDSLWSIHSQIDDIYKNIGTELFVKPTTNGSSFGASFVSSQDELEIALDHLLGLYGEVMVEEFIRGKEATVGILENFRNESHYILPPIEIIPPDDAKFFDTDVKYNGRTTELVPGRFSYSEKQKLAEMALLAHTTLGLEHYSRSDFLIKDGEVYFLEVNTLPGLTSESLFPKSAQAVGLEFKQLIEHLIETSKY